MNVENICYGCFREKEPGERVCLQCGFDETEEQPFLALPLGAILNGRYMVGKVLGVGGFGITYLGFDLTLEIKVAIKEYMPSGMVTRNADRYTVSLTGRLENEYRAGEERFLDEARILAKLQNTQNIVSVQNYFRENNTAYFVMEYVEGMSLKEYLAEQGGKIPYNEAVSILKPVMEALVQVHAMNLMHRDISPDNICITSKGESKLLDFGAARFSMGEGKSVSVILKHGYAPEEQYSSHGNQGPWTDVYAMGATLYRCITGILPPDSIERNHNDTLKTPSELGVRIPKQAENALMKALALKPENRFSNMQAFIGELSGKVSVSDRVAASVAKKAEGAGYRSNDGTEGKKPSGALNQLTGKMSKNPAMRWVVIGAVVLIVALIIIVPLFFSSKKGSSHANRSTGGSSTSVSSTPDVPSSDPAPTEQLQEYDLGILNASISVPADYVLSEDGFTFTNEAEGRTIGTDFYWTAGVPIYSISDVESNHQAILDQYVNEMGNIKDYNILTAGPDEVGSQTAFQIYFNVTDTEGSSKDMVLMAVEGQNGYGCYFLSGAYPKGDEEAHLEIHEIIDTFQSNGAVDVSTRLYESQTLGFKFLYDESLVQDGMQEMESELIGGAVVQCLMISPSTDESATLIEVENAAVYASTPEEALAFIHNNMSANPSAVAGEPYTEVYGGVTWQFRDYSIDSYTFSTAAAEIGGQCYVAGILTDETNFDTAVSLWIQVLKTIRPL